ncbi:MAG: HAMP domain-containing sensor histidine kinase [Elusimicrobia bacterium]|nr:HAMP domain-containing sensor histidine kinase [Elusimicrobiota bacterium]
MSAATAFLGGVLLGAGGSAAGAWWLWRRRNARLGRFFSHAAHEINTPITAINITVMNLLSGVFGEVPPEQVKWVDMMREQVARLGGMVGELRDLIHLVLSRDLNIQVENAPVSELVAAAVACVRRDGAAGQGEVKVEVPAELPRVRVDRERAVRTLASLLFHARKFRTGGELVMGGRRDGSRVKLELRYRGHPLPAGEAERSLALLYPALGPNRHTLTAVGLGLGVLRAVAERQGGDLSFRVAPDGEARLTLSWPVSPR